MAQTLHVLWEGRLVGQLQDVGGQLQFTYESDWLAWDAAKPLSQSLPLQAKTFPHHACRPFFAGLLPEDEKREQIARAVGVTAENDFSLLDRLGGDCAGAISFVRAGSSSSEPVPPDYRKLSDEDLARILEILPERPLLAGDQGVRLSLAGAQAKLPVLLQSNEISLPLGTAPSSHIIKPKLRNIAETVANEAFCLRLAALSGIHAIESTIRQAKTERFLIVDRYDRIRQDGRLVRLHQEDFCQALSIPPEHKYETEGGPSLAQCFDLVRRTTSRPTTDLVRLLDYVIFNVLVGNNDAHGKNFSLIYFPNGRIELAPMYDVLSTAAYPRLSRLMAMGIGGQLDADALLPRNWDALANEAELAKPLVRRRIIEMTQAVLMALEYAQRLLLAYTDNSPIIDPIVGSIRDRTGNIREAFARAAVSGGTA